MRRTQKKYDIITLEPMPPTFAGVNALYSKEFYELARQKLNNGGIIAQWLPFHIVALRYGASIAKTFQDVFPNAILWIDPPSKTGILIGSKDDSETLGINWPGFARTNIARNLSEAEVKKAVALDSKDLKQYDAFGDTVTDDNQLLAYGLASNFVGNLKAENLDAVSRIK
jgi:spermidine synthase